MTYNKIFIIGFNKTATTTLHRTFKSNNFKSVHWDKGRIDDELKKYNDGFLGTYENNDVFSDSPFIQKNFKKFYKKYPNSLFILNYRNKNDWICSRLNHMINHRNRRKGDGEKYAKYFCNKMSIPYLGIEETIKYWSNEHDEHQENVRNFFKNKKNYIELNIDEDNWLNKLIELFGSEFTVNNKLKRTNNKMYGPIWKFLNNKFVYV